MNTKDDSAPETDEDVLMQIEDSAWLARASALACRFVLGNLLIELQSKGLLDAVGFIGKLQAALPSMTDATMQLGSEVMLCELMAHAVASRSHTPDNGTPQVFH